MSFNEIDEITSWKNEDWLLKELNFQLNMWESIGGQICSQIIEKISSELYANKEYTEISFDKNDSFYQSIK